MPAADPMSPALSRRTFARGVGAALAGAAALGGAALAQEAPAASAAGAAPEIPAGGLTEDALGETLAALGLTATKEKSRYDFQFATTLEGEKWDFTMSAVLSRNGQSLWVMAWLDELPKSAAAVPRSALLKMLAANDRMGAGKFFAYIPANRRFVLQRVVANEAMANKKVRGLLIDLGRSVKAEYGTWSVEGWTRPTGDGTRTAEAPKRPARRVSTNDSKFSGGSRN